MANVLASGGAPLQGAADSVKISWTLNGAAAAVVSVPISAGAFAADFNSGNPGITLKPGDVVGCSGQAVDSKDNLLGPVDQPVPPSVTIPTPVPPPPSDLQNFVLAVS